MAGAYHQYRGMVAYNLVKGNIVYDNGTVAVGTMAGILLEGYADNNTVVDNFCADERLGGNRPQFAGIRLSGEVTSTMVANNTLVDNNGAGVQDTSTGTIIKFGNRVSLSTAHLPRHQSDH